jgi:hypothetical protein
MARQFREADLAGGGKPRAKLADDDIEHGGALPEPTRMWNVPLREKFPM